jgi:hypothetical protein
MKRELSAHEMLEWYEERLSLRELFDDHAEMISWWRRAYHVDESERYLLMWNVIGILGGLVKEPCMAFGGGDGQLSDDERRVQSCLAVADPWERIVLVGRFGFATDGRACLPSGRIVSLWDGLVHGLSPRVLADDLAEQAK